MRNISYLKFEEDGDIRSSCVWKLDECLRYGGAKGEYTTQPIPTLPIILRSFPTPLPWRIRPNHSEICRMRWTSFPLFYSILSLFLLILYVLCCLVRLIGLKRLYAIGDPHSLLEYSLMEFLHLSRRCGSLPGTAPGYLIAITWRPS